MGLRLLIIVIAVLLIVWLARRLFRRPPADTPPREEDMLRCAHCGLHIPASEAIKGPDGTPYCSEEHRDAQSRS